jgi:hypothetical protein
MPHLWIRDESGVGDWAVMQLAGGAVILPAGADGRRATALLLRSRIADEEAWLVMSVIPGGVRLNGARLETGIRMLHDRDELLIAGLGRAFYSTERLARIELFPGAERPVLCPRCRQVIEPQTPAVRSQCGLWHHQAEDLGLPCWTYAPLCAMCDQPTNLTDTYRWTPEAL